MIREFNLSGNMILSGGNGAGTSIPVKIVIKNGKMELTFTIAKFAEVDSMFAGLNTIFGDKEE